MADAQQDFPTVIGPDATFKGEMSFEKGLRLQGRFEGKINTGGRLHVSKEAKLMADVEATAITVEGEVRGNLSANDRIELKQSARYEGDLNATKLVVDEGAVFSGHVTVGPDAVKGGSGGGGNNRMRDAIGAGRDNARPIPGAGPQPAKVAT
jgi:cytoskeletal protein CcmA (bactofilin family)